MADMPPQTSAQSELPKAQAANSPEAAISSRHCLRYTGSRIHASRRERLRRSGQKADGQDCVAAAGRAYSREDIERSGGFDLLDALRRLDPAIY